MKKSMWVVAFTGTVSGTLRDGYLDETFGVRRIGRTEPFEATKAEAKKKLLEALRLNKESVIGGAYLIELRRS